MTGIFMIGARRATQRALEDIARGKNDNDDQMRLLLHCSNPFIHQYPGSYGEESSLLPVHCDKYTEVGSIVAPSHRRCVECSQSNIIYMNTPISFVILIAASCSSRAAMTVFW